MDKKIVDDCYKCPLINIDSCHKTYGVEGNRPPTPCKVPDEYFKATKKLKK